MSHADAERCVLEQLGRSGVTTMLGRHLRIGSAGRLHLASMYVQLARMEDRGIITGWPDFEGRRYTITDSGRAQLASYKDSLPIAVARPPRVR